MKPIALVGALILSCLFLADAAVADWNNSWSEARRMTANVVNDRYGIDVLPREVGCLPRPRRSHVTTRSVAHRWVCTWVHTIERDGYGSERVCSGTIQIIGSDAGKYDYYFSVVNGKSCEWL
jgi:hypothetical protein